MTWIKVSDRLPEDKTTVLIYAGELGTEIYDFHRKRVRTFIATFRQGRGPDPEPPWASYDQWGNNKRPWGWDGDHGGTFYGQDVTHWMPLPEAP
jgi:hypothetical protein